MLTNEQPLSASSPAPTSLEHQAAAAPPSPHRPRPQVRLTLDLSVPTASNRRIIGFYGTYAALILAGSACCIGGYLITLSNIDLWLWSNAEDTVSLVPGSNGGRWESDSSSSSSSSLVASLSSHASPSPSPVSPADLAWLGYAPYAPCTTFRSHGCDLLPNLQQVLTDTIFYSFLPFIPLVLAQLLETGLSKLLLGNSSWHCGYQNALANETNDSASGNTARGVLVHVGNFGMPTTESSDTGHGANDDSSMDLRCNFTLTCSPGDLAPMVNLTTAVLRNVNETDTTVWPDGVWPSMSSSPSASSDGAAGSVGRADVSVELIAEQAANVTTAYNVRYTSCADVLHNVCQQASQGPRPLALEYLLIPDANGNGVLRRCSGESGSEQGSGNGNGLERNVTICQSSFYERENMAPSAVIGDGDPTVGVNISTEVATLYHETINSLYIQGANWGSALWSYSTPAVMFMTAEAVAGVILIFVVLVGYTLPVQRFQRRQMRTALETDASVQVEQFIARQEQRRERRRSRRHRQQQLSWTQHREREGGYPQAQSRHADVQLPRENEGQGASMPLQPSSYADVYGTAEYLPRTDNPPSTLAAHRDPMHATNAPRVQHEANTPPLPESTRKATIQAPTEPAHNAFEEPLAMSAPQHHAPISAVSDANMRTAVSAVTHSSVPVETERGRQDLFTVPLDDAESMSLLPSSSSSSTSSSCMLPDGKSGPGDGIPEETREQTQAAQVSNQGNTTSHDEETMNRESPPLTAAHADVALREATHSSPPAPSSVVVSQQVDGPFHNQADEHTPPLIMDEPVFEVEMTSMNPNSTEDRQRIVSATTRITSPSSQVQHVGVTTSTRYVDDDYSDLDVYYDDDSDDGEEGEEGQRHLQGTHQSVITTRAATVVLTTVVASEKRRMWRRKRGKVAFREDPRVLEHIAVDARAIMVRLYEKQSRTMRILFFFMVFLNTAAAVLMVISFSFVLVGRGSTIQSLSGNLVESPDGGRDWLRPGGPGTNGLRPQVARGYRAYYKYNSTLKFQILTAWGFSLLVCAYVVVVLTRRFGVF